MRKNDTDRTLSITLPQPESHQLDKSHAALIVLQGREIGRDYRLRKSRLVIGRSPDAEIRIHTGAASRRHARIEREETPAGDAAVYSVVDLGSTNGTFVNSQRIRRIDLRDGDKIQIGDTVLKFVLLDHIESVFHAEVRDRITYDRLTGLLTKESLFVALDAELERCSRYGLPLAVMMMDLDFFKSVNDGHGHLMGSHVLSEVGRLIRGAIRVADVSGRYGGEEFISYLVETDTVGARLAAERIRTAIAGHSFGLDGVTIGVTISIGVAAMPLDGSTRSGLIKAADEALYRAKEQGRNRVVLTSDRD